MALVQQGFKLTVTLVDASIEDQAVLTYKLDAVTYADAATARTAILALLDAVTACSIKSHNLSEIFVEDALVVPASGVEVENRAKVIAQIDGDPLKTATFFIPGASDALFLAPTGPGRNVVDPADANLIAYAGIWNVTSGYANISDGEYLEDGSSNGVLSGTRDHRKNSRG